MQEAVKRAVVVFVQGELVVRALEFVRQTSSSGAPVNQPLESLGHVGPHVV